jgi:hypothetical protein
LALHLDWENSPRAQDILTEVAYNDPDCTDYELYVAALAEEGYPTTAGAVRTQLYRMGLGSAYARKRARAHDAHEAAVELERPDLAHFVSDKKEGQANWRELIALLDQKQELERKASWSQDEWNGGWPEARAPIHIIFLADWHLSSMGTDHRLALQITDEITRHPDLRVMICGDMSQMAIKLRGVAEVQDNGYNSVLQQQIIEGWLGELLPQVLGSTWDNHSVEREEQGTGVSMYAHIMKRKVPYFNGIGHLNLQVGPQTYKMMVTHKAKGRSRNNPVYGQMMYMRHEDNDREIAVAGDTHLPGLLRYEEGGKHRVAINTGSLQSSGFGKRYFSLSSHAVFPVLTLWPDAHLIGTCYSFEEWQRVYNRL